MQAVVAGNEHLDPNDVEYAWNVAMQKLNVSHLLGTARAMDNAADVVSKIGTVGVIALGAGALGVGAVAAYTKGRSALRKRRYEKFTEYEDEKKNPRKQDDASLKHADGGQVDLVEILDSMSDEQKFAVMKLIEVIQGGEYK